MSPFDLAGWLMVAASVLAVAWQLGLAASGGGLSNRPISEWPALAARMRWTVSAWIVQTLLIFAGVAVLGATVFDSGGSGFGIIGAALMGVSVVLVIIEGTLHMSVGIWIASAKAKTGEVPSLAAPFFDWTGTRLQTTFYALWMFAFTALGVALLELAVVARWVAVVTVGWGVASVAYAAIFRRYQTWEMIFPIAPLLGVALLV